MARLYVLLPVKDEEKSLQAVFDNLTQHTESLEIPTSIVLCDDGSTDGTAQLLKQFEISHDLTVLTHSLNRGLGETIRDLFEYAADIADPEDAIVRLDCDNTHDAKYIPSMLAKLDEGNDVVIASRFCGDNGSSSNEGLSVFRRMISAGATVYMRLFFPIKGVKDYTCGYRAYRAGMVQKAIKFYGNDLIQLKGMGFVCTLEKLIKLNLIGARITEIPFVLRYDKKLSHSKMMPTITTLGYLIMLLLFYWPWNGWRSYYKQKFAGRKSD